VSGLKAYWLGGFEGASPNFLAMVKLYHTELALKNPECWFIQKSLLTMFNPLYYGVTMVAIQTFLRER
jgi:hypothetical protein